MIIRRETLQAALTVTTADDTRYHLNAVRLEPAAHRAIATDGHVLLIATDKHPQPDVEFPTVPGAEYHGDPNGPVLVDAEVVKSIISAMPKKTTFAPILGSAQLGRNGSDTTATLSATDLHAPRVATIEIADAPQFPNYDRVIPKADRPSVRVILAVDVLERLIKAAKAVQGKERKAITFDIPTDQRDRFQDTDEKKGEVCSAVTVQITGTDVDIFGVAMPMRP